MHAIQRNQIHGIRSCVADIEVRRNGRYVMPGIYRKRGGRAPKGSRRITLSWNFAGCLACPYHSRAINFIPVLKDILSTPAITTTICHHISALRDEKRKENIELEDSYIRWTVFLEDDWCKKPRNFYIYIDHVYWRRWMQRKTFCLILFRRYLILLFIIFLMFSFLQDSNHAWEWNTMKSRAKWLHDFRSTETCFSNPTSFNLEHPPVFFQHPRVYIRAPSLHKCGSFHYEIISSSWRG